MTHCAVIWARPEIFSFSGSVCCSFIRSVIVVVVVDGAVGKTSLLITSHIKGSDYGPHSHNSTVNVMINH